jgi:hypothetical protein
LVYPRWLSLLSGSSSSACSKLRQQWYIGQKSANLRLPGVWR